jgi:hypothetical protein
MTPSLAAAVVERGGAWWSAVIVRGGGEDLGRCARRKAAVGAPLTRQAAD